MAPHDAAVQRTPASATRYAPYLVLAHHRSGSNFLNDLLQAHPRLECINEPLSMHTPYFRECDLETWSGADFDPRGLHRSLGPHEGLRQFLLEMRDYLEQSGPARVIGFKETVLFGKLGWLKAFLPGLKILFLKRHVHAVVSSVLRSNLLPLWNYAELVPPAFRRAFPGGRAPASTRDEAVRTAQLVAMSVVTRYRLAEQGLHAFDHRVIELQQLMREPERGLQDITGFLGVAACDEQLLFLEQRQSASRGGTFSSFRSRQDVEETWQQHLTRVQVEAIDAVLAATDGL